MARKKQTETRVGEKVTPDRKKQIRDIQAERRKRLTQAANKAGFDTIDKLASAIINGQVVVTSVDSEIIRKSE